MLRMLWLVLALMFALPAHAQEPEPAPGPLEKLDAAFGTWLVTPLYKAMFFDLIFWDDKLPKGEGLGTVVGDEEITGWTEEGYRYQARLVLPADTLLRVLSEPVVIDHGGTPVTITRVGDVYTATTASGPMPADTCPDLEFCGAPLAESLSFVDGKASEVEIKGCCTLELASPIIEGEHVRLLMPEKGPPRVVRLTDAGIVAIGATREVSPSVVPVEVGVTVGTDRGPAEVLSIEEGQATLRLLEARTDKASLSNPEQTNIPLVVAWLVIGAVFFTLRMSFINLRGFKHAIFVTMGHYDHPDDTGEITHFQALSSALSATVGLGNIAGVAIAVAVGGPGAIFWMVVAGFLGMSSKFVECTLGQMYRQVDDRGRVSGGPMWYLDLGLRDLGMGVLGKPLAIIFAVMCIGGSLGGGNMFQANQSFAAVANVVPLFEGRGWLYGLLLSALVGSVILGGIKRIGKAASAIVPLMCGIYVLAALFIVVTNASEVPAAFGHILTEAFTPEAGRGGIIGVIVQGFRRAAFSNEAGVGSASIAHSAATTEEPVREGIVALLEPFIDTIIVCTMTGLVIVITGAYSHDTAGDGVLMTSYAFSTVIDWFPLVLSFAVVLFAFSTMISWSYYGERCATYLFGDWASTPYKVVFLFFVFFGSVFKLGNVLDFSDLMVLGMAFPNILGLLLLSGKVRRALDDYWRRLKSGEMKTIR